MVRRARREQLKVRRYVILEIPSKGAKADLILRDVSGS
jgi:hypothetical protein